MNYCHNQSDIYFLTGSYISALVLETRHLENWRRLQNTLVPEGVFGALPRSWLLYNGFSVLQH
jgi:hypothetical protein